MIGAIVVGLCLTCACAVRSGARRGFAAPPAGPSEWQRVEDLAVDSTVVIDLVSGERRQGRLRAADSNGVTLGAVDSTAVTISRSEVGALYARERARSTAKSTLIGTAVGAAAGIALGAGLSPQIDVARRVTVPILGAAGAAAGAIAGYVAGRSRSRRVLIYQAP